MKNFSSINTQTDAFADSLKSYSYFILLIYQFDFIIIIIIYESCSAKSTNENDGALHSHKTLS